MEPGGILRPQEEEFARSAARSNVPESRGSPCDDAGLRHISGLEAKTEEKARQLNCDPPSKKP